MKQAWIIGLGGIGTAIKTALEQDNIQVTAFSRSAEQPLDITSEAAINDLVKDCQQLPDSIIITPGLLHDEAHQPEKTISHLEADWLLASVTLNVLPTLYFAKALNKRLKRSECITLTSFSARVSSISDNHLGGWHSYRMSKCMLNMLIKNIAIEWALKSPASIIFGYHPGTVDTPLSKPFQSRIVRDKLFTPKQAADYFIDCLRSRTVEHSGKLYDWRQQEIAP